VAKRTHDKQISDGISRGAWADLWAMEQEEKGRSFSGQDITEAAPKTPAWAKKWGEGVAAKICELNHSDLGSLYRLVKKHGFPHDEESFGILLGLQSIGHGVSWSDDTRGLPDDAIQLPKTDFYR
jgi:hypothetical protein